MAGDPGNHCPSCLKGRLVLVLCVYRRHWGWDVGEAIRSCKVAFPFDWENTEAQKLGTPIREQGHLGVKSRGAIWMQCARCCDCYLR